jgi:hypothetical protein
MVESEHGFSADCFLQQRPVPVPYLVQHEDQVLVVLQRKILAAEFIVQCCREYQLIPRLMEVFTLFFDQFLPFSLLRKQFLASFIFLITIYLVQFISPTSLYQPIHECAPKTLSCKI